jgi:peptidoglycan hydrolase CwlO-like protein
MSDEHEPSRSDVGARSSPAVILLSLLALVVLVVLGVYETIPSKKRGAAAPDPTSQAIRDLQASVQQTVDQLKGLELKVSSGQAETKQLSERVNLLSGKIEALEQSSVSLQQAPASVAPIESAKPKHVAR